MTPVNPASDWPTVSNGNSKKSVFASDLLIEGDVQSDGPIVVHGRLHGSVHAPAVVIAVSGQIDGSVAAHDLCVLGGVSGTISARIVQFAMTAVVDADVMHERITIEAGADIEGRLFRRT